MLTSMKFLANPINMVVCMTGTFWNFSFNKLSTAMFVENKKNGYEQ